MLAAWKARKTVRELLRADPGNNFKRTFKGAEKRLQCVKFEAVRRFFKVFFSQLEVRIKDGD